MAAYPPYRQVAGSPGQDSSYRDRKTPYGGATLDDIKEAVVETVRLKIKKGVAEHFGAISFHDSQQFKPLQDGEAEVTFRVSGAGEMIPWLMSWGAALEVLEPQWLKDELVGSLENTLYIYGS